MSVLPDAFEVFEVGVANPSVIRITPTSFIGSGLNLSRLVESESATVTPFTTVCKQLDSELGTVPFSLPCVSFYAKVINTGVEYTAAILGLTDKSGVAIGIDEIPEDELPLDDDARFISKDFERISPGEDISSNEFLASSLSLRPAPITDQNDAKSFLLERYFSALYRRSIPLQVFAKTAIPRIRTLCNDEKPVLQATLSALIIKNIAEFDVRHQMSGSKNGLLSASFMTPEEEGYRKDFINGGIDVADDDGKTEDVKETERRLEEKKDPVERLHDLLLALKEREARLQVMLLIELLSALPDSKSGSPSPSPQLDVEAKKLPKKRLVSRKNRLIVSTLGGIVRPQAASLSEEKLNVVHAWTNESIKAMLFALLDRLCVWDALVGRGSTHDESAFKFMMSCVVPYVRKTHNKLVKDILLRIKGPSLNSVEKKASKKKTRKQVVPVTLDSSFNAGDFERPVMLKRTTSNLTSTKELAKKSFDMTIKTSFTSKAPPSLQNAAPLLPSNQSTIFSTNGNSKKRKLGISKSTSFAQPAPTMPSLTQVMATPSKQDRVKNVLPEMQATPISKRDVIQIEATPVRSGDEPAYSSPYGPLRSILSSPITMASRESNINEKSSSTRRKPGEPVLPSDSPFYEHHVQDDDDDDIENSPKRLMKKELLNGSPVRYKSMYLRKI
ncbi:unnamed protein product [Kuraishia capsulata CBS 1993]|uniref:DNA replication regulator Sld3 C-terminal domain-containing protein n=1 Tax=Kuraishia capsulata CBS 1993 TaxID=1382522 RepID=W6MJD5_9ASCO|nr:uncharacterized protein KUCA_T00000497001 [Kuraishia capsulata CBS 1993]CDK24532.1 unnamed protein product [Kuraishia capsulata CBS 1993]